METTGTVSLSPDFFANEVSAYSDWETAFWRELFQNSVDVGAREVEVSVGDVDGLCKIEFVDDGPGMPIEVLRGVYFCLGATTKGVGSIGGFGRARIVTCFAHESYAIESCNYRVDGAGAGFRVIEGGIGRRGCMVAVNTRHAGAAQMLDKLRQYLGTCQLGLKVVVNGVQHTDWTYRYRVAGKVSFGAVHVNRSHHDNQVLVRVNGVTMFTRHTPLDARVILELEPGRSRSVLTSNRDGLVRAFQNEFDGLMEKFAADCSGGLREQHAPERTVFGSPSKRLRRVGASFDETQVVEDVPVLGPAKSAGWNFSVGVGTASACGDGCAAVFGEPDVAPIDYVVYVDSSSKRLRSAARKFTPDVIRGTRKERLLHGWSKACEVAVLALMELRSMDFVDFSTGFAFTDDALAIHMEESGEHSLLLRPVDESGKVIYSPGSAETVNAFLALAAHEVAHVVETYHNEYYAGVLTELFGKVSRRHNEIRRAMAASPKKL